MSPCSGGDVMTRWLLRVALALAAIALIPPASTSAATAVTHTYAWGDNADGEVGNGTLTQYGGLAAPVQASNLAAVSSVAGGSDFSLALKSDGTVWAWGNGGWGQLGQGTYASSTVPIQIHSLSGVTAL